MADMAEGAMNGDFPAYGLWLLVAVNAGTFIDFVSSFLGPKSGQLSNQGVDL